jgi:hypothetical protein
MIDFMNWRTAYKIPGMLAYIVDVMRFNISAGLMECIIGIHGFQL